MAGIVKTQTGLATRTWALALAVATVGATFSSSAADGPRERISIDADWRFAREGPNAGPDVSYNALKTWILPTGNAFLKDAGARAGSPTGVAPIPGNAATNANESDWRRLDVPHDFGIEGPFIADGDGATGRLPYYGTAWYRKHLALPASDQGKRIFLDMDGVMSYATVWLNGNLVGGWPYGYASWRVDLTPYVKPGADNVLAVRVDNPPNSSRWYPGGGIYRNVWLVKTNPVHVGQWGTYITTPDVSASAATIKVQTAVDNNGGQDATVSVALEFFALDAQGRRTGASVAAMKLDGLLVPAGKTAQPSMAVTIPNPKLWSPKSPSRYVAVTTVTQDVTVLDTYETPFGIRSIKFDPNAGLLINGEHVRINGVCNHHDLGALGSAVNYRALQRQLELLQEMGCNAIRTSHNPPAPELLDLADQMGFVVMDEAFDCWQRQKRPNDYHLLFNDWHEQDLRALVRRDRNHPSVVLWSIGNEVNEQGTPAGAELAARLAGIVRDEDATRPITSAANNAQSGFNGFHDALDVMGFNYKPNLYKQFHQDTPGQPFLSSESASTISSRGEYTYPVAAQPGAISAAPRGRGRGAATATAPATLPTPPGQDVATFQMSSYDLYYPSWATSPDTEFAGQDRNPASAGEFVWTGFDYIGEPTPWGGANDPSRSSYFGIIDLAGFKKDRFYLYQAHWRPELPMAHILPHWNWPERVGEVTPVHVYTSGDEAELFLNGQSLGRKKKGEFEYRLRWDDVKYAAGELKVVAYKDGKQWATDTVKTTGPASKLLLQPDRATIAADGQDLSFVTLTVADRENLMVPRSKNLVHFGISGPGEIVATDNGDATDPVIFASHDRKAFNGLALAIVKARRGQSGAITLTAKSDGLPDATVTITGQ